jgi:ABC-type dipeptide/oligopeptide/nickel transport system ATPase component
VPTTACPFCFTRINSSKLAYQCIDRGNKKCTKGEDPVRAKLTGSQLRSFPTGLKEHCDNCGGPAPRRACPACHTVLPIDFVDSRSPMVGLVGSKGSGKTVLMTVLIKQLRGVVGRRFGADIRIATDNPDGMQGLSKYQEDRESPLYDSGILPTGTAQQGSAGRQRATPIVLRWRQESPRKVGGGTTLNSTVLSFVDTAGEDLNDFDTAFTLRYVSVCDYLVITLDPFALGGARAGLNLPQEATQVADDVPMDVVARITDMLRTEQKIRKKKRIRVPVAVVFPKIDAFYPTLERQNPIMTAPAGLPSYDDADGQAVHEHMLALLSDWGASDIEDHLRLNYSAYRYFGVSALGAEPDYGKGKVAAGGVQPHRVEDPVLWLMAKAGTVGVQ